MAKSFTKKIVISGYDELFGGTPDGKCDAYIQEVSVDKLKPFKDHPFKVREDNEFNRLKESIRGNGVLVPIMVRPLKNGNYEIISGHRRKKAAEKVGLISIPAVVTDMDDDSTVIAMVDSNMQRETILPSEKAFSYKMKHDALKHQGKRSDLDGTSVPGEQKLNAREQVALDAGESPAQIRRYIRLTSLITGLLDKIDSSQIGLKQGVELSYLTTREQEELLAVLGGDSLSLTQAKNIRNLSKEGKCTKDAITIVLQVTSLL